MNIDLQNVAVIGACGKMGRGIALLLLQEMALKALSSGDFSTHLKLIDTNEQGFYELKVYLLQQLTRFAEKNINSLRKVCVNRQDIVSNEEAITAFVETALRFADCSQEIAHVKGAEIIFEAAFENILLKKDIIKAIQEYAPKAWVLSNTSSIPLSLLAQGSNRVIGFHFYNPPPIQKLLELIPMEGGDPELELLAKELANKLRKTLVISKDVAGFIGNGHFVREMVFASELVKELSSHYSQEEAVQFVDAITRDFLLRPMGIFELLDYVGLHIADQILKIMREHLPDSAIHSLLIQKWVAEGLKGGQDLNGHSKDGIYQYQQGKATAIYSLEKKAYVPLGSFEELGKVPLGLSWKRPQKEQLPAYFKEIFQSKNLGCQWAARFLRRSYEIEKQLVANGVAQSLEDVATVLKNGFHHFYAPHEVIK